MPFNFFTQYQFYLEKFYHPLTCYHPVESITIYMLFGRQNSSMDGQVLHSAGPIIRQESHSHHCLCIWTSANLMVQFLLWSPNSSLPVSCRALLLFCKVDRCQHLSHPLWRYEHLFCRKYCFLILLEVQGMDWWSSSIFWTSRNHQYMIDCVRIIISYILHRL